MMANYVLIKPDVLGCDEFITKGGLKLYIDTQSLPELHINCWGKVAKNPMGLYYKNMTQGTLNWDTECETEIGDHVLYDFVAAAQALGKLYDKNFECDDTKYLFCEDELYIVLRYDSLFLAKRNDEMIMLNGYVLVTPVEEEIKSSLVLIPEHIKKKQSLKYGIVAAKGSMINEYATITPHDPIETDYCFTIQIKEGKECRIKHTDIEIGDMICFERLNDITIEYDVHKKLDKNYFRMQRRDIVAIINK